MKVYWDTSAIVRYFADGRVAEISGVTRTHSLAELFSTFTGRGFDMKIGGGLKHKRLSLRAAAAALKRIRAQLEFVELSPDDVLNAVEQARKFGAQGGRVHDLLHAVAAAKAKADELWTLDKNDFDGFNLVEVKQI